MPGLSTGGAEAAPAPPPARRVRSPAPGRPRDVERTAPGPGGHLFDVASGRRSTQERGQPGGTPDVARPLIARVRVAHARGSPAGSTSSSVSVSRWITPRSLAGVRGGRHHPDRYTAPEPATCCGASRSSRGEPATAASSCTPSDTPRRAPRRRPAATPRWCRSPWAQLLRHHGGRLQPRGTGAAARGGRPARPGAPQVTIAVPRAALLHPLLYSHERRATLVGWPTSGSPGTGPRPPGRRRPLRSTRPPAGLVPAGPAPRRSVHYRRESSRLRHSADCAARRQGPDLHRQ